MPITFISASSANSNGATSITVNVPSGTLTGHLMLCSLSFRGGTGVTLSPPAGWDLVRRVDNGTTIGMATYRRAASDEPASYNFGVSPTNKIAIGITTFSGVLTTNPVIAENGQTTASSTTLTTPTVNITVQPSMVVAALTTATGTAFTDGSWTAGMVERVDDASGGGSAGTRNTLGMASGPRVVTGNFSVSGVAGAAAVGVSQLVALREDPNFGLGQHRMMAFF